MDPVEILILILKALFIFFLILIPCLILVLGLIFELRDNIWKILKVFSLIILPLVGIIVSAIIVITDFKLISGSEWALWWFITPIIWFGYGMILFKTLP